MDSYLSENSKTVALYSTIVTAGVVFLYKNLFSGSGKKRDKKFANKNNKKTSSKMKLFFADVNQKKIGVEVKSKNEKIYEEKKFIIIKKEEEKEESEKENNKECATSYDKMKKFLEKVNKEQTSNVNSNSNSTNSNNISSNNPLQLTAPSKRDQIFYCLLGNMLEKK
jgi:hypothetical protein